MYFITHIPNMGRGIIATKDIPTGCIIMVNHVLILSPEDTIEINKTALKLYTFKYSAKQDCLLMGEGEIFNHSDSPNVYYVLNKRSDIMTFMSIKDIKKGEQLFIDYKSDDPSINIEEYLK